MTMTPAEKQKTYRRRQKEREIANALYGGRTTLTVEEFRAANEYEEQEFWDALEGLGEETIEHSDERDSVRENAYQETYETEFGDLYAHYLDESEDEDEARELAHEEADELAREAADEAVKDWERQIDNYKETRVAYSLMDLIEADRAARGF